MGGATPLRGPSARRFDSFLVAQGLEGRVVELPDTTRTAADAAKAVGCEVRQIVKSLVFRGRSSGTPILILVSGANRVDETWMAQFTSQPLERAHPEFARSATGFAIGGVPPAGHSSPIPTFIDYDLLELPELWAAAGSPNAVFRLTSRELLGLSHGRPVPVTPFVAGSDASVPWETFDCYGTLVDWRAGFVETVKRIGLAPTSGAGERLFRRYLSEERSVESGAFRSYREVMISTLIRAVQLTDGTELAPERARELPESIPEWPIFPDVLPALDALRGRGIRVGILSNIDRDLLDATLARHGLVADGVVTAEAVRSYKPAPPHWIRFLKEQRLLPSAVTHVSASYEYDHATAAALGFRTVYVARDGPLAPGATVSEVVPDLVGLADLRIAPDSNGSSIHR